MVNKDDGVEVAPATILSGLHLYTYMQTNPQASWSEYGATLQWRVC